MKHYYNFGGNTDFVSCHPSEVLTGSCIVLIFRQDGADATDAQPPDGFPTRSITATRRQQRRRVTSRHDFVQSEVIQCKVLTLWYMKEWSKDVLLHDVIDLLEYIFCTYSTATAKMGIMVISWSVHIVTATIDGNVCLGDGSVTTSTGTRIWLVVLWSPSWMPILTLKDSRLLRADFWNPATYWRQTVAVEFSHNTHVMFTTNNSEPESDSHQPTRTLVWNQSKSICFQCRCPNVCFKVCNQKNVKFPKNRS